MKRRKKYEERVADLLAEHGFEFAREHVVDFQCVDSQTDDGDGRIRARVDFLLIGNGVVVIVEVDEQQHAYGRFYESCDGSRMTRIHESWALDGNTMDVIFVRYCPNGIWIDSNGDERSVSRHARETKLVKLLREALGSKRGEEVSMSRLRIMYVYYNMDSELGMPVVVAQMPDTLRECCVW